MQILKESSLSLFSMLCYMYIFIYCEKCIDLKSKENKIKYKAEK